MNGIVSIVCSALLTCALSVRADSPANPAESITNPDPNTYPNTSANTNTATASAAPKASAAKARPQRVVSLSLCLDELVMALADQSQIAAVSALARDPRYSSEWQYARQLPSHQGNVEQIIRLQPDLILAAEYEQSKAAQVLVQLGFHVLTVQNPTALSDAPRYVRRVAIALGATNRAEQQLRDMQTDFAQTASAMKNKPPLLALSYAPNGYTPGTDSIKNALFHLAGFVTVADRLQRPFDSEISIELLLQNQPDVIFLEEQTGNQHSLAQRLLQHPALRQSPGRLHRQTFPSQYWLCPGLQLGKAVKALAAARS